jgi:hypothetical protein
MSEPLTAEQQHQRRHDAGVESGVRVAAEQIGYEKIKGDASVG